MSEAITEMVVVARGMASPRALVRGEVIAISRMRANEGISLVLGMVAAGVDRLLGWFWVDFSWLDVFSGFSSPRG